MESIPSPTQLMNFNYSEQDSAYCFEQMQIDSLLSSLRKQRKPSSNKVEKAVVFTDGRNKVYLLVKVSGFVFGERTFKASAWHQAPSKNKDNEKFISDFISQASMLASTSKSLSGLDKAYQKHHELTVTHVLTEESQDLSFLIKKFTATIWKLINKINERYLRQKRPLGLHVSPKITTDHIRHLRAKEFRVRLSVTRETPELTEFCELTEELVKEIMHGGCIEKGDHIAISIQAIQQQIEFFTVKHEFPHNTEIIQLTKLALSLKRISSSDRDDSIL